MSKCISLRIQELPSYIMVKYFMMMISKLVVGTHMFDQWNAQHCNHHSMLSSSGNFDNSNELYLSRLFDLFQLYLLIKTSIIYVNLKSINHYVGFYSSLLPLYYNLYCLWSCSQYTVKHYQKSYFVMCLIEIRFLHKLNT
jgi:hypothetical protein